jgi:hypothetical protein
MSVEHSFTTYHDWKIIDGAKVLFDGLYSKNYTQSEWQSLIYLE